MGFNFVWYVDGYDKLKLFGLYFYGWIDGYSRWIMWLEVVFINRNLVVIVKYYFDCI